MKLVELLAKDLSDWPEACKTMTQDADGDVNMYEGANPKTTSSGRVWLDDYFIDYAKRSDEVADDQSTAIVTRAQWQAERDRQKGGEWKRHRGGKQPVADDTYIEYKLRDGFKLSRVAGGLDWSHYNSEGDIMQYRIISQPQAEEVKLSKAEARRPFMGESTWTVIDEAPDYSVGQWNQIDGPIKWRDTIIHCQAIIEDCEREIERNVQLLDAEGLMMQKDSKKAMQHYVPDVDLANWRNWKAGDTLECTHSNYNSLYVAGRTYKVQEVTELYASVYDECGGHSACNIEDGDDENLAFIRR